MTQPTRRSILLILAIGIMMGGAGALQAQTADGFTPAEEEVCDIFSGAAFGLCNAYCEAMDCELLDDGDELTSPNASATACLKVKDNFIKITGLGALPCDCYADPGQEGCFCQVDSDCASRTCNVEIATCEEGGGAIEN
jgi:hypothetical protein